MKVKEGIADETMEGSAGAERRWRGETARV